MKYSKIQYLLRSYEEAIRLSERLSVAQNQLIPGPALTELGERIASAEKMADAAKLQILSLLEMTTSAEVSLAKRYAEISLEHMEFVHEGKVYQAVRNEEEAGGWDAVHDGTRIVWSRTHGAYLIKELQALKEALIAFLRSKGFEP